MISRPLNDLNKCQCTSFFNMQPNPVLKQASYNTRKKFALPSTHADAGVGPQGSLNAPVRGKQRFCCQHIITETPVTYMSGQKTYLDCPNQHEQKSLSFLIPCCIVPGNFPFCVFFLRQCFPRHPTPTWKLHIGCQDKNKTHELRCFIDKYN